MKDHYPPRGRQGAKQPHPKKVFSRLRAFAVCSSVACAAQQPFARVELSAPQGQLAVDGAPAGEVKGKTRFTLRPGHHVFELRAADGRVEVREADLGPGDQVALDLAGASR